MKSGRYDRRRAARHQGPSPPPPFPQPLAQAAIRDPAKRPVVQVPAQVLGQCGGVRIPVRGPLGQALREDVLEADAHPGITLAQGGLEVVGGRGARAAQRLAEQQAQGIVVRAMIDRFGDRFAGRDRIQRGAVLGRHPARGPADPIGEPLPGADRPACQVEVQEHRRAVGRDQHVGGLDVHVDQAVGVGLLQGVGQPRADPADRLDIRDLLDLAAVRPIERGGLGARGLQAIQHMDDVPASTIGGGDRRQRLQDSREARAAQVGHAQRPQPTLGEGVLGEQGDDVRVLEPGEREVLLLVVGDHLQDDRAVRQGRLRGEVRLAGGAPAELRAQEERPEVLADLGEFGRVRERAQQTIAAEQDLELALPARVPDDHLGGGHVLARFAAEVDLLVDQPDGRLVGDPGMAVDDLARQDAMPARPGLGHRVDLARDP